MPNPKYVLTCFAAVYTQRRWSRLNGLLGVVVGDDVLAQLGPDGLEEEAQVPDDREVAQDRVLALHEVVDRHDDEERDDRHQQPLPPAHDAPLPRTMPAPR